MSALSSHQFQVNAEGNRFEKELEKLRREMELASATGTSASSTADPSAPSSPSWAEGTSPGKGSNDGNQTDGLFNSPLILPAAKRNGDYIEVPELILNKAVEGKYDETKKDI